MSKVPVYSLNNLASRQRAWVKKHDLQEGDIVRIRTTPARYKNKDLYYSVPQEWLDRNAKNKTKLKVLSINYQSIYLGSWSLPFYCLEIVSQERITINII